MGGERKRKRKKNQSENMADQSDTGFGMDGIQTMGILNALKTGDVRMDMIIAMSIPFVLRYVFNFIENMNQHLDFNQWKKWWKYRNRRYQRFLVYKSTRSWWGGSTSI